ncbi:hypothetical protein [Streptomyces albidoflavus]|uniref:hypothetical protein n=1 Tax=Streptomyces albidoflavus TaxID=1886 RepID=UPI00211C4AC7|nr:hypothetical protein [Streptomyces albidoflavus]
MEPRDDRSMESGAMARPDRGRDRDAEGKARNARPRDGLPDEAPQPRARHAVLGPVPPLRVLHLLAHPRILVSTVPVRRRAPVLARVAGYGGALHELDTPRMVGR